MSFWEQFAIMQATAALHVIVLRYATKYFTPAEQQALNLIIDAIIDLPARIHLMQHPPSLSQAVASQTTIKK